MTTFSIRAKFEGAGNVAGTLFLECGDLPALKGSPKQVEWAEGIRRSTQRQLGEVLASLAGVKLGLVTARDLDKPDYAQHVAEIHGKLDALVADPRFGKGLEALTTIFGIADCRFWIDNRGNIGSLADVEVLGRAARAYTLAK